MFDNSGGGQGMGTWENKGGKWEEAERDVGVMHGREAREE